MGDNFICISNSQTSENFMNATNDNNQHSVLNILRQIALNNLQAISADFSVIQKRMDKDVRDYQAGRK